MSSNPKKWIPILFAITSSFKFPALTTPSEIDRVMKDCSRMTSLQEHLKALCFYFACLTTVLLCQVQFVCFLSRKTPHHYWNNCYLNFSNLIIIHAALTQPVHLILVRWMSLETRWKTSWKHDLERNPCLKQFQTRVSFNSLNSFFIGFLNSSKFSQFAYW